MKRSLHLMTGALVALLWSLPGPSRGQVPEAQPTWTATVPCSYDVWETTWGGWEPAFPMADRFDSWRYRLSSAMTVDGLGNTYVAVPRNGGGTIYGYWDSPLAVPGTHLDYAIMKFAPNGALIWTAAYAPAVCSLWEDTTFEDIPRALALDPAGNVVVTGESGSAIATLKLNGATGEVLWTQTYVIGESGRSRGLALVVGSGGDVFVGGESCDASGMWYLTLLKYGSSGQQLWEVQWGDGLAYVTPMGNGGLRMLALDTAGNVHACTNWWVDEFAWGMALVKLTADGAMAPSWPDAGDGVGVRRFVAEDAYGIAPDGSGGVVAISYDWTEDMAGATRRIQADGAEAWKRTWTGLAPAALNVGTDGSVLVAGDIAGDIGIVRYGPDGAEAWRRVWSGPGGDVDRAYDILGDGSGGAWVVGTTWSGMDLVPYEDWWWWTFRDQDHQPYGGRGTDLVTLHCDADGEVTWQHVLDGPGTERDVHVLPAGVSIPYGYWHYSSERSEFPLGLAVDAGGALRVAGFLWDGYPAYAFADYYLGWGFGPEDRQGYLLTVLCYENTQPGNDVELTLDGGTEEPGGVDMSFGTVTAPGTTTVTTSSSGPTPPHGFEIGTPPTYYDIVTEATFSGSIKVAINYSNISYDNESQLKLFHYDTSTGLWEDVTTSVDAVNKVIYGSVMSLSPFVIAEPNIVEVAVDIKPGAHPNSINLGSNGVVPVAILSATDFDATTVDPLSVTLASASVKLKGNGTPMVSIEDVNGDGRLDMVVHVSTQALQLTVTDTQALLTGSTLDGTTIRGSDTVRVIP